MNYQKVKIEVIKENFSKIENIKSKKLIFLWALDKLIDKLKEPPITQKIKCNKCLKIVGYCQTHKEKTAISWEVRCNRCLREEKNITKKFMENSKLNEFNKGYQTAVKDYDIFQKPSKKTSSQNRVLRHGGKNE